MEKELDELKKTNLKFIDHEEKSVAGLVETIGVDERGRVGLKLGEESPVFKTDRGNVIFLDSVFCREMIPQDFKECRFAALTRTDDRNELLSG